MRNTIKNIWQREREGSSLVTVIIGILFIAAIGTILLTIASRYFISVNVDHNASDNFYQTEGILEEVKTGLLEYAGDAGEEAYKDVKKEFEQGFQGCINHTDTQSRISQFGFFPRKIY